MALSTDSHSLLSIEDLRQLKEAKLAVVRTEWNEKIVAEQMAGCRRIIDALDARIVLDTIVPGAFEIPFAVKQIEHSLHNRADAPEAIIAFGAVIRGGTPHFDYVCKAVTEGLVQLNTRMSVPVIFGVLTLDTEAQAWERLGGVHGHKGEEAAIAALKMIQLNRSLF